MSKHLWPGASGPFRANHLRSGDPYELSQGHPIACAPTGQDGSGPNGLGFAVLDSDPAVRRAGVDAGLALRDDTLRAPDVAVNFTPGEGTWARSAPLVVEYAGAGQDEGDLREKIAEYHAAGTDHVWVVRLARRCVEVHERTRPMRVVAADGELTAPGVLALPVPVRALFDRDVAHETTLRNILSAKGYASLEAIRDEARREGLDAGLLAGRREVLLLLLASAGVMVTADDRAAVAGCTELAVLDRWILRARTARDRAEVFAAG